MILRCYYTFSVLSCQIQFPVCQMLCNSSAFRFTVTESAHLKFVCDKGADSLLAKLHVLTVSAVNAQIWPNCYDAFLIFPEPSRIVCNPVTFIVNYKRHIDL